MKWRRAKLKAQAKAELKAEGLETEQAKLQAKSKAHALHLLHVLRIPREAKGKARKARTPRPWAIPVVDLYL